jgi:CRISPR-associated protein Csb2
MAAPSRTSLRSVTSFVPNNDLDAKGGDPALLATIRTAKTLRPSVFDADRPAAYLWTFDGDDGLAHRLAELASRLHTLGHGIDAAFAHAEVLDAVDAGAKLAALGGAPHRPVARSAVSTGGTPCPTQGSLESLRVRHESFRGRFERVGSGRKAVVQFRQPSKPHVRSVAYDRTPACLSFELRPSQGAARFQTWPLAEVTALTIAVRDQLARALKHAWPDEVNRLVIGRGAGPADSAMRLRIIPLPSIGMRHTDPGIRRVVLEIPPDHPIPLPDLEWALAGRELADAHGEPTSVVLTPTNDTSMLERYGVGGRLAAARVWCTVTPAALPVARSRDGLGRAQAEAKIAGAIGHALRHAGITAPVADVTIQREPFDLKGERADHFAPDRFDARDLRHVELTFSRPVAGPMLIGNGRFLGLGLMRPVRDREVKDWAKTEGVYVFEIKHGPTLQESDAKAITRALRRAVMARAQAVARQRLKRGEALPTFFTGHAETGGRGAVSAPAATGLHEHLFYGLDPGSEGRPPRFLVIAPHQADRNRDVRRRTRGHLDWLAQAVTELDDLRAGSLGRFTLAPGAIQPDDSVLASGAIWTSLMPYRPTRYPRRGEEVAASLRADVLTECARRGLPKPDVDIVEWKVGERGGLAARVRLRFVKAVAGPILLGANSHFGSGLFCLDH